MAGKVKTLSNLTLLEPALALISMYPEHYTISPTFLMTKNLYYCQQRHQSGVTAPHPKAPRTQRHSTETKQLLVRASNGYSRTLPRATSKTINCRGSGRPDFAQAMSIRAILGAVPALNGDDTRTPLDY